MNAYLLKGSTRSFLFPLVRFKQMCSTYFFFQVTMFGGHRFVSPLLIRSHSLHVFVKNLRSLRPSIFRTGELNLAIRYRRTDGMVEWDRDGQTDRYSPYGWGAAPYLGSAKRGAGLPFPVASFLCVLEPATE